jgi:16S rRNA (cytosine1402-N4)-methyltransferase
MRFNPDEGEPVWQWLARADEKSIADAIYEYGEERFSRRIAKRIVERRRESPIRTASQLRELVGGCVPRPSQKGRDRRGKRPSRIDPATRTFQALRILVNDELGELKRALESLPDLLCDGGRLLIISFHSLEDRIVKYAFREDERLKIITKKPVCASPTEQQRNPRSRSAKLRVAQRVFS